MGEAINYVVYGWYPYLCLTVFLLGSLLRFDREQYTWRSGSSQLLRRRQLIWGSNLFHVGILLIFAGHFVGLLTPIWVFGLLGISHTFKQWMAIGIGGVAGCSTRASAGPPRSATSRFCSCSTPSWCSGSPRFRSRSITSTAARW
jgi:respiratory nitrate reductase gamma subunit